MDNFQATQIGQHAKQQFTLHPHGKVLAAFSNIIYLLDASKEISWIADLSSSMHRRCLQIFYLKSDFHAGINYFIEQEVIHLGPTVRIDLSKAQVWAPVECDLSERMTIQIVKDRILSAFYTILDAASPRGLGVFLSDIIALSTGYSSFELRDRDNLIETIAGPILKKITIAVTQSDIASVISESANLVGLGEGLTPSGDDFFGGLIFCLNHIRKFFPEAPELHEQIRLEELKESTNRISFSIMSDMMKGHGIEPIHQLLQNIISGGAQKTIYENYSRLLRIGHSTGWDILTGVVIGLLTFYFFLTKQTQINIYDENYIQTETGGI